MIALLLTVALADPSNLVTKDIITKGAEELATEFGLQARESTRVDAGKGERVPLTEYVNEKDSSVLVFVLPSL